jgi:hypothetical protein
MPGDQRFNGVALASIAAGGLFVFAGIKGYSIPSTIQDIIQGKSPLKQTQTTAITAGTATPAQNEQTIASNGPVPGAGPCSASATTANKLLGMAMVTAVWPTQFPAFNSIVMAESGWCTTIENGSGAYGIPQALPASKMASAGADWQTSAATQIKWMIGYIKSGEAGGGQAGNDPDSVWVFHQANGWY